MSETTSTRGTRWLRACALIVGAMIPVGVIGASTAGSAMAMGFAAQSVRGTFVTDGIVTNDPLGIILHPQLTKDAEGNTYMQYVVKLQATNATVRGLCIAEKATMFGQTFTLIIESDDQAIQVTGVQGTVYSVSTALTATGSIQLNQNAADISIGGESLGGRQGELGIAAGGASLGPSHGTLQAAHIKGANIADFHARLVPGDASC